MQQGHRKRLRDRFMKEGLSAFTPAEALELLLFYAIPQRDVKPLAHRLLEKFGSLENVLAAPPEALSTVEGIGEHAASLLCLIVPFSRYVDILRQGEKPRLRTRSEAKAYCMALMRGQSEECFYLISLDIHMVVSGTALIAAGGPDAVAVQPRQVVESALRHNAHSLILCHNHPGGSPEPSRADIEATQRIAAALTPIGVSLADHIIIAGSEAVSFVEAGLITHG